MDMNVPDGECRRALLSFLLMECVEELRGWAGAQGELGDVQFPNDDEAWEFRPAEVAVPQGRSFRPSEPVRTQPRPAPHSEAKPTESGTSRSVASFMALNRAGSREAVRTPEQKQAALGLLRSQAQSCRKCGLGAKRRGVMWGTGPADASIMFVAAGGNPAELDAGRVLTGEAAALLDKIIAAMEALNKEAAAERIYMTNVIKCACIPSRDTRMDVARQCLYYLREEVRLVRPKVIVMWGEMVYHAMLGGDQLISQARGKVLRFEGIPAIATHHPMEMINNPNLKGRVWSDLKLAVSLL